MAHMVPIGMVLDLRALGMVTLGMVTIGMVLDLRVLGMVTIGMVTTAIHMDTVKYSPEHQLRHQQLIQHQLRHQQLTQHQLKHQLQKETHTTMDTLTMVLSMDQMEQHLVNKPSLKPNQLTSVFPKKNSPALKHNTEMITSRMLR